LTCCQKPPTRTRRNQTDPLPDFRAQAMRATVPAVCPAQSNALVTLRLDTQGVTSNRRQCRHLRRFFGCLGIRAVAKEEPPRILQGHLVQVSHIFGVYFEPSAAAVAAVWQRMMLRRAWFCGRSRKSARKAEKLDDLGKNFFASLLWIGSRRILSCQLNRRRVVSMSANDGSSFCGYQGRSGNCT